MAKEKIPRALPQTIHQLDLEIQRLQRIIQIVPHEEEDSSLATAQRMYLAGLRQAKEILLA